MPSVTKMGHVDLLVNPPASNHPGHASNGAIPVMMPVSMYSLRGVMHCRHDHGYFGTVRSLAAELLHCPPQQLWSSAAAEGRPNKWMSTCCIQSLSTIMCLTHTAYMASYLSAM